MTDTEQRAPVEVIQADREAAAIMCSGGLEDNVRKGQCDLFDIVQAFARHRLTFSQHPATGGEGRGVRGSVDPTDHSALAEALGSIAWKKLGGHYTIDGVNALNAANALSTLTPIPDGAGEAVRPWQSVASAPHACCVQACRFDEASGEWIYAIVNSPPPRPFVWWKMLDAPPADPWPALPSEKGEG